MDLITTRLQINSTTASVQIEQPQPFDHVDVIAFATVLILFMIVGTAGNLLTILVILSSRKLKSIFNLLILSMCFSDLASASISWINLHRRTWGFTKFALPNFFCVLYWAVDMWTSFVTALHILSFAVLRLFYVWKPNVASKIKLRQGRIWILFIWVAGGLCGVIPYAIFSGAKIRDRSNRTSPTARWPSCTQNEETIEEYSAYIKYTYPIFFYFPSVSIVFVSTALGVIIVQKRRNMQTRRSSNRKRVLRNQKNEKQALLQLGLIVGSFIMGYLPFTVYEYWTVHNRDVSYAGWRREWLFGTLQYVCLRFSECLNPMFYNLASAKMRTETKKFMLKLFCSTNNERFRLGGTTTSKSQKSQSTIKL